MTDRIIQAVAAALGQNAAHGRHLCVGLSGGVDSTILLDTLDRLRAEFRLTLTALHVNHQISSRATDWEAFCEALCKGRGIPLAVRRVDVVDEGSGIEAAARDQRYRAYAEMDADFVVLAHHLDDQVETFLLQLLRGAGPRGLAAMPVLRQRDGQVPAILRPLLGVARAEIESRAKARQLDWVEDESNANTRFDRNFLRRELLPLIESRFPGYRDTLTRASRNLADDLLLADDLALLDAGEAQGRAVPVEQLRRLSDARALNLLRYLFARRGLAMPPRTRLEEAMRQCRDAGADAETHVSFGTHGLRSYRGVVTLVEERDQPQGWQAQWDGRRELVLPEGMGSLYPRPTTGSGIAVRYFREQPATVRGRSGGESLKPAGNRPSRSLKNLFQEAAVPPWERDRMPLLFFGERLAWVPGIGVAVEFRAAAAEPGVEPDWRQA